VTNHPLVTDSVTNLALPSNYHSSHAWDGVPPQTNATWL